MHNMAVNTYLLTFNKSSGWVQQAAAAEATPPWYHNDVRLVGSTVISTVD